MPNRFWIKDFIGQLLKPLLTLGTGIQFHKGN